MFECCIIYPGMRWYHKANNIRSRGRVWLRKHADPGNRWWWWSNNNTNMSTPRSPGGANKFHVISVDWGGHNAPPLSSDEGPTEMRGAMKTHGLSPDKIFPPGSLISSFMPAELRFSLYVSTSENNSVRKCFISVRWGGMAGEECLATIWKIFLTCSAEGRGKHSLCSQ